jgi:hypothetical protein
MSLPREIRANSVRTKLASISRSRNVAELARQPECERCRFLNVTQALQPKSSTVEEAMRKRGRHTRRGAGRHLQWPMATAVDVGLRSKKDG